MTAIGDHFYRFDLDRLQKPEQLGPHRVMLPHAMKLTASGRYVCYGSMDSPRFGRQGEAKHVGVFDLKSGEATAIRLPATCWHVVAAPRRTSSTQPHSACCRGTTSTTTSGRWHS